MPYAKRVGAMLVLASLAFVLVGNAEPSSFATTQGSSMSPGERTVGYEGSAVLASDTAREVAATTRGRGTSPHHADDVAIRAKASPSSAPRALLVPRGQPLTVERNENDPELAVIEAAREYGQDPALMLCVAQHESSMHPLKLGLAEERGLFQFKPRTWGYYRRDANALAVWTGNSAALGYGEQDVWLPIPAARVAASLWAKGQQGAWTTWKGCAT